MSRSLRRSLAVVGVLPALLLASCGYDATQVPHPQSTASDAGSSTPATCRTTPRTLRSYAPSRTGGSAVRRIQQAGVLVAGVSADTYRMAARDPFTNKIQGFDIDIAQRIADELGVGLRLRVISAADRIPLLDNHQLDIVVRAFTINCDRWQDIAFSGEYYHAGQEVLLRKDLAAKYHGPQDLAGLRVCAPAGTTSLDNIRKVAPEADRVPATTHTACLVRFQQGEVDAITGDDTVLAGLAAQDPYAVIPQGQKALEPEPYGVGMNADDKDLAGYVNAVLEEMETDGSWQRSYDHWLKDVLGPATAANRPHPTYGRS